MARIKDPQGRTQSAITYAKVDAAGGAGSGAIAFTLGQGFNADGQLAS